MKMRILGSTKINSIPNKEEILKLGGYAAGICYMRGNINEILNEDNEKTLRRIKNTISSGHHSVYGHFYLNIYLENIPKILAMILNNEKAYNTSEKSARYTKMNIIGKEKELYAKWVKLFFENIKFKYPNFNDNQIEKLSMENARYLISIFTPSTSLLYTVEYRQLNYLLYWCKNFIENQKNDDFYIKIKDVLKKFVELFNSYIQIDLNTENKNRRLSLFAIRHRKEEWGENYSTNYFATFSQLAQAQRHRTINYEMQNILQNKFYVPKIIKNTVLEDEWLKDINSIEYPQGKIVKVNERGTYENFISKCEERLCGTAQLEIMEQTRKTLVNYINGVEDYNYAVYHALKQYDTNGPRCTFGWKCIKPCAFGKAAFERDV